MIESKTIIIWIRPWCHHWRIIARKCIIVSRAAKWWWNRIRLWALVALHSMKKINNRLKGSRKRVLELGNLWYRKVGLVIFTIMSNTLKEILKTQQLIPNSVSNFLYFLNHAFFCRKCDKEWNRGLKNKFNLNKQWYFSLFTISQHKAF